MQAWDSEYTQNTALHWAASFAAPAMEALLLEARVSVTAVNTDGVTALHEPKEKAYSDLMAKHPEIAAKAKQTQLKLVKQLDAIPQAQKVLKDACGVDNHVVNPEARAVVSAGSRFVTMKDVVAHAAKEAGLEVAKQDVIPWAKVKGTYDRYMVHDCISILRKPK